MRFRVFVVFVVLVIVSVMFPLRVGLCLLVVDPFARCIYVFLRRCVSV